MRPGAERLWLGWAGHAEGGPLHVQSQSGLQYIESRDRGADLPPREAYFEPFVKAAAKTFDCDGPAADRRP